MQIELFIPADVPYEVEYSVSESIVANLRLCNYTEPELFRFRAPGECARLFLQLLTDWQAEHSPNQAKAAIYGMLEKIDRELKTSTRDSAFATCLQYIEEHFEKNNQPLTIHVCIGEKISLMLHMQRESKN